MTDQRRRRSFLRRERGGGIPGSDADSRPTEPLQEEGVGFRPEADPRELEERARIVVPRSGRAARPELGLDVELREVRYGATARGPYLRMVPRKRRLTRVAPGYIKATRLGSEPRTPAGRLFAALRRLVLGSPLAVAQLVHERLSKVKALAIIGSDPLSSSAYATEEALVILAIAGATALVYLTPISAVIAALLVIVAISYRQTIRAYPGGGGAYTVAHENLGRLPGLISAGALMVDYTLLVSVSTAAGVAAITSAAPELFPYRVELAVVVVGLFTLANLRGIREAGSIFAAPTLFFIFAMSLTVIAGVVRVAIGDAPGTLTSAAPPSQDVLAQQGLTLWLVLRAFSSGAAALTGVEAMANGVPAFKPPEARNARITLTWMAFIGVFLFLGISFLASRYGLVPTEEETVVSMMGRSILGENVLYFGFQAATASILFLAANTSFNAFPLLSATLARHDYMPRQFFFRGDRLAYTNGILILAIIAAGLLIFYDADVTKLIPLYAIGVFIAFTLSQSGMVVHWWRARESGWRWALGLNAFGAAATCVVAVIIGLTRFTHGAWIALLMTGALVVMFFLIFRHYRWFNAHVRIDPDGAPAGMLQPVSASREHVVVPVDSVNKVTVGAVRLARGRSDLVTAIHVTDNLEEAERFRLIWSRTLPDIPLLTIESPWRSFTSPMIAYVESLRQSETDRQITVVLPTITPRHWWERLLHNQDVARLKPLLIGLEGVSVIDFPYSLYEGD